jgi:hypothetical protein
MRPTYAYFLFCLMALALANLMPPVPDSVLTNPVAPQTHAAQTLPK